MRVFFTLVVNYYGGKVGLVNAAPVVLGVFLAPFLLAVPARAARSPLVLDVSVLGLVVARVAAQLATASTLRLVLAGAATVLGLLSLVAALTRVRTGDQADVVDGAHRYAAGVVWGLVLDGALHGVFLSWDPAWRTGPLPVVVVLGEAVAVVVLWRVLRRTLPGAVHEPAFGVGLGAAVLGPFLAAHLMMLHNVGFAASHGVAIPAAVALVLAGDAAAMTALHAVASRGIGRAEAAVLLACTLAVALVLPPATGVVGAVAFVAAHAVAAVALRCGLAGPPGATQRDGAWRTAVALGIGTVLFVLAPVAYFYGQREPLPFAPTVLFDVVLVMVGLGYVPALAPGRTRTVRAWALRPQLAPLVPLALVVWLVAASTGADVARASAPDGTFRLVDFNVSYGVDRDGQVDPEGIARVIESQHPDVVALQEVTRGWIIAGNIDLYDWLAHRLGMPYRAFAPAADRQFGNAVLSRFPILDVATADLPVGSAAQGRSYLRVELDLGPDRVTVYDVHLSAWSDASTRLGQVETILASWRSQPRTIVAGDMNASPGEPDMARMLDAGFRSAQDEAGDPAAITSTDPDERIDWVFATADLEIRDFATVPSRASDHLALVTTMAVRRSA